ncbi:GntR family transcriptional regulator [Paenibacillus nasutitermitis]|uniref:HTH gntR-type domain-containing protein n=1 Tax=Paenibacillus nasutitermitis TaxID=1652958 RepID=A0A916Z1Y3_9BACL|nr:GntR family transcriptional regulator [Paenibacillus nasutitermitis]GGD69790.1 hypothetical protein GCM10010911_29560 [Paenibacillus nasutitermitis]
MGLRKEAYDAILQWMLTNELTKGSVTSEIELSKRLDMSRTPVRAALQQLETEGYVRIVPKHGVLILDSSADRVSDLFDTLAALVLFAIEQARAADPDELGGLGCLAERTFKDLLPADRGKYNSGALGRFEYELLRDLSSLGHNQEFARLFELTTAKLFWFHNDRRWQSPYQAATVECLDRFLAMLAEPTSFLPGTLLHYFQLLKRTWS